MPWNVRKMVIFSFDRSNWWKTNQTTNHHIYERAKGFISESFWEPEVFNGNEARCVLHLRPTSASKKREKSEVKYFKALSGNERTAITVILGGACEAQMGTPVTVFKNFKRSYSIRGLANDTTEMTYCSSQKDWADYVLFSNWLNSPLILTLLSNSRTIVIWVNNCSAYMLTPQAQVVLRQRRLKLRLFV